MGDLRFVSSGQTGLEPATSGVTDRHSNQLSYYPLRVSLKRPGPFRDGKTEFPGTPRRSNISRVRGDRAGQKNKI